MSKIYGIGDEEELAEDLQKELPNRIIEEIEKIRQEIYDIEEPDHDFEGFYYCFEEALKIIDKELAKMKGENENDK